MSWTKAAEAFSDGVNREFVMSVFDNFGRSGVDGELEKLKADSEICKQLYLSASEELSSKGRVNAVIPVFAAIMAVLVML